MQITNMKRNYLSWTAAAVILFYSGNFQLLANQDAQSVTEEKIPRSSVIYSVEKKGNVIIPTKLCKNCENNPPSSSQSSSEGTPLLNGNGKGKEKVEEEKNPTCFEGFVNFCSNIRQKLNINSLDIGGDKNFDVADGSGMSLLLNPGIAFSFKQVNNDSVANELKDEGFNPKFLKVEKVNFGAIGNLATIPLEVLPIHPSLRSEKAFYFFKYFNTELDAFKASPFKISQIPINAERAKKMAVGEMVVLPTKLSLVLDGNLPIPVEFMTVTVGGTLILSGKFQIQVLRLPNNKVRVRITLQREKGVSASATLRPGFDLINLPGVADTVGVACDSGGVGGIASKLGFGLLTSQLNLNILRATVSGKMGDTLEFDYIFNLNDEEACKAYDSLLSQKETLKNSLKTLGRVIKTEINTKITEAEEKIVSNLEKTQRITMEDADKETKDRRIIQLFRSHDKYRTAAVDLGSSVILAEGSVGATSSVHDLVFTTPSTEKERYLFSTSSYEGSGKTIFGLSKESWDQSMMMAVKKDDKGKLLPHETLFGTSVQRSDTILTKSEWAVFMKHTRGNLPEEVYSKLEKDLNEKLGGTYLDSAKKGTHLNFQILFQKKAVEHLSTLTLDDWKQGLKDFARSEGKDRELLRHLDKIKHLVTLSLAGNVPKMLYEIFSTESTLTAEERAKEYRKLKTSLLYQVMGPGFIASLLPKENLESYINVLVDINGVIPKEKNNGESNYHFEFGEDKSGFFKTFPSILKATSTGSHYFVPPKVAKSNPLPTSLPN